jgi:hypothetical protein
LPRDWRIPRTGRVSVSLLYISLPNATKFLLLHQMMPFDQHLAVSGHHPAAVLPPPQVEAFCGRRSFAPATESGWVCSFGRLRVPGRRRILSSSSSRRYCGASSSRESRVGPGSNGLELQARDGLSPIQTTGGGRLRTRQLELTATIRSRLATSTARRARMRLRNGESTATPPQSRPSRRA